MCHSSYFEQKPQRGRSACAAVCPLCAASIFHFLRNVCGKKNEGLTVNTGNRHIKNWRL